MPFTKDEDGYDVFECPVCGSQECEEIYLVDGETVGCDQCVKKKYVGDLEVEETNQDHDDRKDWDAEL